MNKIAKISLFLMIAGGCVFTSFADRGIGKKKNKVVLNVNTHNTTLKNSIAFNLNSGLKYKGSLLTGSTKQTTGIYVSSNLVTYQKGNSVYILPYKQKVVVSEVKAGYAGMKLIIKAP